MPQLTAKPLIQQGCIALDPAPDGDVIHREPALRHHFLQISVAERIPQIPPDTQNDEDLLEVSPPEQRCRFRITVSPYQIRPLHLQQIPFY
jgi:hypothetical protein